MLYAIAHFLRDRLPFIWDLIDLLNSWIFGLRYGSKLRMIESITLEKYGKESPKYVYEYCKEMVEAVNKAADAL